MNYDKATGYYYAEVPTTCIATDADENESESNFDLAHSPNTRVCLLYTSPSPRDCS